MGFGSVRRDGYQDEGIDKGQQDNQKQQYWYTSEVKNQIPDSKKSGKLIQ